MTKKELIKEELLKEAEVRYPKGTKFSPAHVDQPECIYTVIDNWRDHGSGISVRIEEAEHWVPNIYWSGKWATILTTEPIINNNYNII